MDKIKLKTRTVRFEDCGLDSECNILQAPKCECGCGEYANLVLKTHQDVVDLCYGLLEDQECCHCAIFVMNKDNTVTLGYKTEDEDDDIISRVVTLGSPEKTDTYIDVVKELQNQFRFHCYGLMEQCDDDLYRIIME